MKIALDQDEEVSKSLKLFGSMLVMDGEDVVTIICKRATPCGMTVKAGEICSLVIFMWRLCQEVKVQGVKPHDNVQMETSQRPHVTIVEVDVVEVGCCPLLIILLRMIDYYLEVHTHSKHAP
jgi:hypothetical protein